MEVLDYSNYATSGSPLPKPKSSINYGPELLSTVWSMTAISIVIITLRLVGNYKFHTLQMSDLIVLLALILLLIASVISNIAVDNGYGKTAGSLLPDHEMRSLKYSAIGQAMVILAATVGRIAFIFYLIELLATRKIHRIILWALVPLQIVVNVVSVLLLFLQCSTHMDQLFDPGTRKNCMSIDVQIDYAYFQGAFNSACDLLLAVWPILIFWRFNWTLRIKLVLISLLSLGIFAMAASLVKTIEYPTIIKSTNPRTNKVTLLRWMFIEAGIVLITASIPCLRPLVVHFMRKIINRRGSTHKRLDAMSNSKILSVSQLSESIKSRWMAHSGKPRERQGSDFEAQILANLTTHIFAGDREFLDKHVPGIVKQVEVTVVADEIPLTELDTR